MNQKLPESGTSRWWYWLLILPLLAMFWVPSYNRIEPEWGGVPFFCWYQLLWIPVAAGLILIVHFATHQQS